MSAEQSNKITLQYPVSVGMDGGGTATVSELTIQRIKGRHLHLIPPSMLEGKSTNPAKMIPLIAALTGIKEEVAKDIDLADLVAIVNVLGTLMGDVLGK